LPLFSSVSAVTDCRRTALCVSMRSGE
jgi:hypothetical protein